MSASKSYSEEFKQEAVRRSYTSGKSVRAVAKELDLSVNTLYEWRRLHRRKKLSAAGSTPAQLTGSEEELQRLRRENELLRQERDILKKAIGYFTQPPQK